MPHSETPIGLLTVTEIWEHISSRPIVVGMAWYDDRQHSLDGEVAHNLPTDLEGAMAMRGAAEYLYARYKGEA